MELFLGVLRVQRFADSFLGESLYRMVNLVLERSGTLSPADRDVDVAGFGERERAVAGAVAASSRTNGGNG